MPNTSLTKQRSLVDKENKRLELMEERQQLMDQLWSLSRESAAGANMPIWWSWIWVNQLTERSIRKQSDAAINRLNEVNKEIADLNKTAPIWPVKQDTQWIKDYVNSLKTNNTTWWNNKSWWTRTLSKTWNAKAVKQQEPTYVDTNWVTHTWMTQDEFNQSMQMYEADNQWWYEHQRNQVIWDNWTTRWQIFDQAIEKFLADPSSFNDSQKQALVKVWQQLWYFNWSSTTPTTDQTENQTVTETIQPTVTTTPTTTQRSVNNSNDAYYAPQWRPHFWVTL